MMGSSCLLSILGHDYLCLQHVNMQLWVVSYMGIVPSWLPFKSTCFYFLEAMIIVLQKTNKNKKTCENFMFCTRSPTCHKSNNDSYSIQHGTTKLGLEWTYNHQSCTPSTLHVTHTLDQTKANIVCPNLYPMRTFFPMSKANQWTQQHHSTIKFEFTRMSMKFQKTKFTQ